jgi:uncharacterized repeat protein (TIGR01451 family)
VTFVSASGGGVNNSGVVSWSLGTLASGQVSNVTVTVTVPASGTLTNVATVSSPTGDPNSTNNVTPPVVTKCDAGGGRGPGQDRPGQRAGGEQPGLHDIGDELRSVQRQQRGGNGHLPLGVTFVSATGGGANNSGVVSWSLGTLASGQVSNVTVTVTAPASGSLTNVASVSSPTVDPNSTNNITPPVITMVTNSALPQADVAVFKTGPTSGVAGSNLTYTVTVTNNGPSTATNVVVSDLLPAGFTFVSASPSSTVSNNLVSWPAINLAKNAVSNFTVTAVSAAGGNFTNIAFATSGTFDPNPTNNNGTLTNAQVRTTVTSLADVAVFKTGSTNINAGSAVVYTITATNMGPSTASNVVVKDNLPAGVTFQSASGSYTLSNNVVTWPGVTLTNGASVNFTLTMTAPVSGSFVNVASGTSDTPDPNMNNNNGSATGSRVSTSVTPVADLIVLLSGPTNVTVGNSLVYTIVVTNGGPSTASNIVVQDNLPAGLTFNSASASGSFSNNIITWPTIPALTNGGSTNFTISVTAPNAGVFTNIASALSSTLDLNLTNNDGTSPASQVQTTVMPAQFMLRHLRHARLQSTDRIVRGAGDRDQHRLDDGCRSAFAGRWTPQRCDALRRYGHHQRHTLCAIQFPIGSRQHRQFRAGILRSQPVAVHEHFDGDCDSAGEFRFARYKRCFHQRDIFGHAHCGRSAHRDRVPDDSREDLYHYLQRQQPVHMAGRHPLHYRQCNNHPMV